MSEPSTWGRVLRRPFIVLRPWTEWLCIHPPLFLATLLLLLIVCFDAGAAFGVPNLFWHENPWEQLQAGFGAAMLLGQLCFIGYLLDADEPWFQPPPPRAHSLLGYLVNPFHTLLLWVVPPDGRCYLTAQGTEPCLRVRLFGTIPESAEEPAEWRALRWYFSITWVPTLIAILLPILRDPVDRWPFGVGVLVLIIVARISIQVAYALERRSLAEWLASTLKLPAPASTTGRQHYLEAAYFLTLVSVYLALVVTPLGTLLSPALAICVFLGVVVSGYGGVAFHFPRWRLPAVGLLVLWMVIANGQVPFKTSFPALEEYYEPGGQASLAEYGLRVDANPKATSGGNGAVPLLDDEKVLDDWLKAHPNEKVVVVATSGGGIRAAVWTAVVLTKLEDDAGLPRFAERLRLITGASGGMLGGAYYAATLGPKPGHYDVQGQPLRSEDLWRNLAKDSLSPVAQHLVLRDFPLALAPVPNREDRGRALERAWERHTDGVLAVPFADLAVGEKAGWRPSLIVSPMLVEDGRQLLISNLNLRPLIESKGSFLMPKDAPTARAAEEAPPQPEARRPRKFRHPTADTAEDRYALSAVEFYRLFPRARDFRLSTAVRMNASFPLVSPAVPLPLAERRHVLDAGYYDNYGVNLAALWLHRHRQTLASAKRGVVLVQIRDYQSEEARRELQAGLAPGTSALARLDLSRGLADLTGPVDGVLSAREAVMSFRNDQQVAALDDYFNTRRRGSFTTVVFECPTQVALNWYLTSKARDELENGFNPDRQEAWNNVRSLERLREVWP